MNFSKCPVTHFSLMGLLVLISVEQRIWEIRKKKLESPTINKLEDMYNQR